jgi:hypothetical protein
MTDYQHILDLITQTETYKKNTLYGSPRRGHSEGTVKAHIERLEENLEILAKNLCLSQDAYWKLKVLIHIHDSFKAEAKRDSAILDPQSHATLARNFLAMYTKDEDMLNMVQYHDIGYAVYRRFKEKGKVDYARLNAALSKIGNTYLFLLFCIIDSCTPSKGREMIKWFSEYVEKEKLPKVNTANIINLLPEGKPLEGEW